MRALRRCLLVGGALAAVAVSFASTSAAAAACLVPPVDAEISAPFVAPECPYCAGQRGLVYSGVSGATVRAAAAGEVTFSGVVVDTRYVVVRHADGLLATYGGLAASSLHHGDHVAAGATVGRSTARLYFGLRIPATALGPDHYIDPAPLLGTLVVAPYLVPVDGSPPRPAPAAELRC